MVVTVEIISSVECANTAEDVFLNKGCTSDFDWDLEDALISKDVKVPAELLAITESAGVEEFCCPKLKIDDLVESEVTTEDRDVNRAVDVGKTVLDEDDIPPVQAETLLGTTDLPVPDRSEPAPAVEDADVTTDSELAVTDESVDRIPELGPTVVVDSTTPLAPVETSSVTLELPVPDRSEPDPGAKDDTADSELTVADEDDTDALLYDVIPL